jgi:hypothetical protein
MKTNKKIHTQSRNTSSVIVTKNRVASGFKSRVIEEERKSRGKAQRIFLIMTHEYSIDDLIRSYDVMGTTGNVYNVCINTSPTCTCPDYMSRHKRCKHIYFVLSRIMKVKDDQEDIEEYTNDDLQDMFDNIPQITENLRADAYKIAKFKALKKNGNGEVVMKDFHEDDVCPICLDDIYDCKDEIAYCKYSCGNVIHKDCFDRYIEHRHEPAKCLYCHKPWEQEKSNYVNLS